MMATQMRFLVTLAACIAALIAAIPSRAAPTVEGFDRIPKCHPQSACDGEDLGKGERSYRLRVRGDSSSYRNASFVVASSSTSIEVVQGTVNIGVLDAGRFVRPTGTFTIRKGPGKLDLGALVFTFSGEITSSTTGASGLSVGVLEFVEAGGIPPHEGTFPIQGSDPSAGSALGLRVDVFGSVSAARYRFLNNAGSVLSEAPLFSSGDASALSPRFFTSVLIPDEPFRVEVALTGTNGTSFWWTSSTYVPQPLRLDVVPAKAFLSKGERVPVTIRLVSGVSATYTVRLFLPTGFSGSEGPWTVSLAAGETHSIATEIRASATPLSFENTVTVEAERIGQSTIPATANFSFLVD
jgi:hypothetical protein